MPNPKDYDVIEVPSVNNLLNEDGDFGNDTILPNLQNITENENIENENTENTENELENQDTLAKDTKITFELMREQANKAFALLGNERPLDTWENVRDVLFEYAKVKYKMTKPIVLEALIDRMIKDEADIQQDTIYNASATYARANDLAVDSSYDGRAIAKP